MSIKEKIKGMSKPRLKLVKGTRATSFLFIATSIVIAAGILLAANMYYNIDTGEVVVEEIQRVTQLMRATAGLVVGGTSTTTLPSGVALEIATTSAVRLSGANQELRFTGGTSNYVGFKATTTLSATSVYTWPASYPAGTNYVLTSDTSGNMSWAAAGTGGIGDVTAVGDCLSGECFTTGGPTSTTLWFKTGTTLKALTIAGTANATYTLPNVSAGTYYFTLATTTLTANRIPIVSGSYTLADTANLTWDSGNVALVVGASGTRGQMRIYSNNANYLAFTPVTSLGSSATYTWPGPPSTSGYVLSSDTSGNLSWVAAATGDITAVGDCASGDCFTATGTGTTLWFKSGSYTGALTVAGLSGNATYTLPAVSGLNTIALGSGTANYVAYWTEANTLGAEQYLSTSRGGIGTSSAAWTGLVRVSGGSWSAFTGTTSSLAYWSSNSQLGSFPFGTAGQLLVSQGSGNVATWTAATYPTTVSGANQAIYSSGANAFTVGTLPVAAGGTGRSSWTQYGVVYADGSTSLTSTVPGTNYYILTGSGSAAPQWRSISQLVFADNGLSVTGTATTTLRLGGTLIQNTTIGLNNYNLLFNLTSGGTAEKFAVQVGGSDILVVNDSGQILYKTYPLAQTGKQVLREMIPIMGFDLPFRCGSACNTATTVSRAIEDYPFSTAETGATRVHKFVIRYADTGTTTSSTWIVYNETDATTTDTFAVPATNSDLAKGKVYITGNVSIPGSGKRWHLRLQTPSGMTIQVYDIMLAAYDQLP
jgi:hypothetical protein